MTDQNASDPTAQQTALKKLEQLVSSAPPTEATSDAAPEGAQADAAAAIPEGPTPEEIAQQQAAQDQLDEQALAEKQAELQLETAQAAPVAAPTETSGLEPGLEIKQLKEIKVAVDDPQPV